MRKMLMIISLLAAASLPALAQNHQREMNNGNPVADLLIAREKAIGEALARKGENAFNSLVPSDALIVNSHGRRTRADIAKLMHDPDYSDAPIVIEDPQVVMLGNDTAILTYKGAARWTYKGESHSVTGYGASIWALRDGEWKAIFHIASVVPQSAPPNKSGQ